MFGYLGGSDIAMRDIWTNYCQVLQKGASYSTCYHKVIVPGAPLHQQSLLPLYMGATNNW